MLAHPFLFLSTFAGGVVSGLSGFGSAIIGQLVWALLGAMVQSPPVGDFTLMYCILTITDVLAAGFYAVHGRSYIRWSVVSVFAIAPVGIVLGQALLVTSPPQIVRALLGLFFLSVATNKLYEDLSQQQKVQNAEQEIVVKDWRSRCRWDLTWRQTVWGMVSAGATGILGGLFGMGGPPAILFFRYLKSSKHETRATFGAMTVLLLNAVRMAVSVGMMRRVRWDMYAAGILGMVLGVTLGNRFHATVDQTLILRVMMCLILLASAEFVQIVPVSNDPLDIFIAVLSILTVLSCTVALGIALHRYWSKRMTPTTTIEL